MKQKIEIKSSDLQEFSQKVRAGPSFKDFILQSEEIKKQAKNSYVEEQTVDETPYLPPLEKVGEGRKVFIETYGCQMNVADSEIVRSVVSNAGFGMAEDLSQVNPPFSLIFFN